MPSDDATMPPDSDPSFVDSVDWGVVECYLAGEGTAAGRQGLEAWIAEAPDRQRLVEAVRAFRIATRAARPRFDTNTAWAAAQIRVGQGIAPSRATHRGLQAWSRGVGASVGRMVPARRGRLLTARAGIAAVVVVLGAGLAVGSLRHRASVASPDRTYTTTAGQRLSVTLGDGTRLTLAPASRVRVAADYSHPVGAREVELEGEAYFTVTHDAAHPFAVRAHGAVARDVGTAFDVRAYPEDAGARIAVAEGAVAVSATSGCRTAWTTSPDGEGTGPTAAGPCEVEAKAGDVASAEAGGVAIEHHEDVATLTAWTAGALQFQNARLSEIAVQLDRWYGLAIAIPDSAVAAHRMTLSVRDNTADETLSAVAVLAHAKYERSGTRVTFSRTSEDH